MSCDSCGTLRPRTTLQCYSKEIEGALGFYKARYPEALSLLCHLY